MKEQAIVEGRSDPLQAITTSELAALLRLSTRKVRAMKSAGQLPKPIRIGRLVRWRRRDVDEWMETLTD